MQPSNPVRLSLSLNFAVFTFNVIKDKEEAVKITEKAIEGGQKRLDDLEDQLDVQDAKTLLDLLRENLLTWEDVDPTVEAQSSESDGE